MEHMFVLEYLTTLAGLTERSRINENQTVNGRPEINLAGPLPSSLFLMRERSQFQISCRRVAAL